MEKKTEIRKVVPENGQWYDDDDVGNGNGNGDGNGDDWNSSKVYKENQQSIVHV